jgi:hypothetical protein
MKTKRLAESAVRSAETVLTVLRKAGEATRDLTPLPSRHDAAVGFAPVTATPQVAEVSAVRPLPASAPVRLTFVEIVAYGVAETAVEFKKLGAQSMAVLLKPDAQTELYLTLQMQEGRIQISARLDAGDAETFQAHWSELQQALARQGVDLSDLDGQSMRNRFVPRSANWFEMPRGQQPPHHRQQPPPDQTPALPAPPRLSSSAFKTVWMPSVALAAVHRLWVIWA